jgi:cell division initiation protein
LSGKGITVSLTVKDILEKTFKRSFKGYDENEVDKFLDQIIDEFKALQNDNAALKEALDAEVERAKRIKDTEETIMHTLVSAQKSAERILGEAARKAEVIIDNSENTAKRRAEQTTKELAEAQRKLEDVKSVARRFAKSFAEMINKEAASFQQIYHSYFGEDAGINAKALEKIDEDIIQSLKGISDEEVFIATEEQKSDKAEEPNEKEIQPEKLMELSEINKALSEIESGGGDILQEDYDDPSQDTKKLKEKLKSSGFKPKYDDYSWLYGNEDKDDPGVSFKDPKEKHKLESLIDDVIE